MTPSLADLVVLWTNENFPGLNWVVSNTLLMDDYGWSFGTVGETTVGWWQYSNPVVIHAADPEFFEKLKAHIKDALSSRGVLYERADMEMTKPKWTLAE